MKQRQQTDTVRKTRRQLEQENCALQSLAELDGLTGLYNRCLLYTSGPGPGGAGRRFRRHCGSGRQCLYCGIYTEGL